MSRHPSSSVVHFQLQEKLKADLSEVSEIQSRNADTVCIVNLWSQAGIPLWLQRVKNVSTLDD